jgi:hypothetical protein
MTTSLCRRSEWSYDSSTSSDAALAPYHVDLSKSFVSERLGGTEEVDADRIARAIEHTRFPYVLSSNDDLIEEEGLLLRAADLIGQLGDPYYLKKANALFYEFEEIGLNKKLGYDTPADVVYKYPQFYCEIQGDNGALHWIGRKTGRQAVADFIRDIRTLTEPASFEVEDILASANRAAMVGALQTRIKATGKIITTQFAIILMITGDVVTRFQKDSFDVSKAART